MPPDQHVAIVSGGSRGLGQAIVSALLEDGHTVATFSRSQTAFIRDRRAECGSRLWWDEVDGADVPALTRFATSVARRFGRVDILINNAASALEGMLSLCKTDDIRRTLIVNLEAAIHLSRLCARPMLRQRSGAIVNISSIVGLRGYAGLSVYSATKGGIEALTRSLARELGPAGIRVNSIAPGYLQTDMNRSLSAAQQEQIVRRTPLGRLGGAADVVASVRFLVSPGAAFITGQTLVVDGGLTC
jgi:3-oxoacyl-[acyl-carrier protein] reductase